MKGVNMSAIDGNLLPSILGINGYHYPQKMKRSKVREKNSTELLIFFSRFSVFLTGVG
jgi:hypothetical protein